MKPAAPSAAANALRTPIVQAQAVLDFWFGDALEDGWPSQSRSALWFGGGAKLDREIEQRFGALVREAVRGDLAGWETDPLDCLALVILLDQFTRNVFRGRPEAFSGDERAQAVASSALARGWDKALPLAGRVFLHVPLMHAENRALQDACVRGLEALLEEAPEHLRKELQGHFDYARQHRDIIRAFGRFPHRNQVLSRASTAREEEFMRTGPHFGQGAAKSDAPKPDPDA